MIGQRREQMDTSRKAIHVRNFGRWRPDVSNPVPPLGATFTPSLVAQDFAATCGKSYEIALQGQDTGDTGMFNLGLTGIFTCPSAMP